MFTRAKIYTYVKWAISVLAYGFLAYKLATFDGYDAFVEQVSSFGAEQFVWLALAVVLLPLNLFLESEKWRLLVGNLVTLDVKTALRSVLIGHTGAFSTPNRLGEYPMRAMSLPSDVRLSAIAMGFVGSFVQNFIITVCGLLALLFFQIGELFSTFFYYFCGLFAVFSFVVFIGLPKFSAYIIRRYPNVRFINFWKSMATFSQRRILKVKAITFVRYVVFGCQFYLILRFCGVPLSLFEALSAIPIVYLCVTYTPSIAVSEAVVRSSYAVLIIGCYSSNLVGITLAGIFIWLLNSAIPMIIGSIFLHFYQKS
ncbi:MAG: flippase-like domain-containing protein [Paludibacteraceae bacterium]|jgi:hypothetical protein|nr:flippase-like domain-containing protein [Paludibacteraceae bacterium]MDI9537495.1 lysylphosphatidylglycerol synthase domain-containing protein [Bacteroidota bacterium]OQC34381.1 MAG: hypothetical protein BWX65_00410 [Bacteroidetes bacterium ADurb.Bin057]HHT61746.1 hypothetical protein [Bacteroidales bacterium]MBP9039746.1 flippase-like domain-containing protein [Paludibacteraceae bacterium]